MGTFITFEGGEGSGKSSHARRLYRELEKLSVPAVLTCEPGGTPLGRRMARLLKWSKDVQITPLAELLLFNVSRSQLVAEVMRPALEAGKVVICDRFADSTTAYQGYGRGLGLETVSAINNTATGGLRPDLTILLDIGAEEGLARKRGNQRDRFEQEEMAFHRRVREGYQKMAKEEPGRWLVVDAGQPREIVAGIIWQRVTKLLSEKGETW